LLFLLVVVPFDWRLHTRIKLPQVDRLQTNEASKGEAAATYPGPEAFATNEDA
jgi:hypothetical protein